MVALTLTDVAGLVCVGGVCVFAGIVFASMQRPKDGDAP